MLEKDRYQEEILACLVGVDRWFACYEDQIRLIMEEYSRSWYDSPETEDGSRGSLDLRLRAISEQPVCWSLEKMARLYPLSGFTYLTPTNGWVRVGESLTDDGFTWSTFHGYFIHDKLDIVACPTFGQFVFPFGERAWGERIDYVFKEIPHLVVRRENGLAMLRGSRKEIRKKIDLSYTQR